MRPMRRLRALDAAITSKASHGADTTPRGADAAPAAGAMAEFPPAFDALSEPPKLLDDDAVKQFLVDGCLALPLTDLPTAFHRDLQAHSRSGFERLQADGLEDRYVYNELPEMGEILSSPQTRGALVSLLGPGYAQHPHRSMHVQGDIDDGMPRIGDGGWHSASLSKRTFARSASMLTRSSAGCRGRAPRPDAPPRAALDHWVLLSVSMHPRHGPDRRYSWIASLE
jgi:hypothetical protein